MQRSKQQTGFTLVEVLVVIGILAILLAITLIAINPSKHFQDTRNTQRRSDVTAVLDAIYAYESANNGNVPPAVANLTSTAAPLSRGASQTATGTTFATPALTFTGLTGNTVTSGMLTVTGCTQTADNGTFLVTAGAATSITVTNPTASATSATGCTLSTGVNLCTDIVPVQIADLPMDPGATAPTGGSTPCATGTTAYDTGYTISKTSGRFTVNAPNAEGTTVSVTR